MEMPLARARDRDMAVIRWRLRRLRHAGFAGVQAEAIAGDRRWDLHRLLELVDHGCPPELAARILAPLDAAPDAGSKQ
jgi:hypothetical protein